MRAIQLSKSESRSFAAHVAVPWHGDGQRFMPLLPTSTGTTRMALGVVFPSTTEVARLLVSRRHPDRRLTRPSPGVA